MTTKQYVLDEHTNAWRPVNQWAKPPQVISHIVTAVVAAAVALGVAAMARGEFDNQQAVTEPVAVVEMPYCQQEDGSDVDGYCLWVSPSGQGYINPTPEERYRNTAFEADTGAYVGGFN